MRANVEVAVVAMLLLAGRAHSQSEAPIELGSIPSFASEADAQRACVRDVVVWADRDSGYFYPRSRPQYGQTPAGTYTCLSAAIAADYWDINPFSVYGSPRAGREFPIDPALLEPGV